MVSFSAICGFFRRRFFKKPGEIFVGDDAIIDDVPCPGADLAGFERGFEPQAHIFERVRRELLL